MYGAMPPLPLLPVIAAAPFAVRMAAKYVPGWTLVGANVPTGSFRFASVEEVKLLCMPQFFCATAADFPRYDVKMYVVPELSDRPTTPMVALGRFATEGLSALILASFHFVMVPR